MITSKGIRELFAGLLPVAVAGIAFVEPVAAQSAGNSQGLFFATSEIAQVLLSIMAVSFVFLAARAYGGEIGKALFIVGGGVIIFATWQLLAGATKLLQVQEPPGSASSVVNLLVTVLLMAGFYMLYETTSSPAT